MAEYQSQSITDLVLSNIELFDANLLTLTKCSKLTNLTINCERLTDRSLGYLKVSSIIILNPIFYSVAA